MVRREGNPDLVKFQFQAKDDEPNNVKLSLWIKPSLMNRLKQLPNKNEFVREAIAKALEENEHKKDDKPQSTVQQIIK